MVSKENIKEGAKSFFGEIFPAYLRWPLGDVISRRSRQKGKLSDTPSGRHLSPRCKYYLYGVLAGGTGVKMGGREWAICTNPRNPYI